MANEVIKVFNTEANALANTATGRIDPVTVSSAETIANVSGEVAPFYIYNKYYYRIEANEPVTEFHIDWDEGEDNSPEKASIEIIKLDTPAFSTVTEHIYTEHKHFYPLIRVKSIDGFLSKWYTNDAATSLSALEDYTVSGGQNEFSIISKEKAGSDRINAFFPSNLPPIAVLKADIKRIYSNIDNTMITGSYPLLYAFSTSTATTKPNIKFTIQDSNGAVMEHTMNNSTSKILTTTSGLTSEGSGGYMSTNCIPSGNYSAQSVASEQRIQFNDGVVTSDLIWGSSNDVYIDLHYESADSPDINGYYHCRVFFHSSSSDVEGSPTGSTVPSGYSSLKVGLDAADNATNNASDSAIQLRAALVANADTQGIEIPISPIDPVVDGASGFYIDCTIQGLGGVTPWAASTAADAHMDLSVVVDGGGTLTKTTAINRLLRVELLNAKNLSDDDRVYIMTFDATTSLGQDATTDDDETVAILSNGNPILELGESFSQVTFDGTESRTRASNVDIANYYIDYDKISLVGGVQSTNATQLSDSLVASSTTRLTNGVNSISYSFDLKDNIVDTNLRMLPTSRLCRLQVTDTSSAATNTNHKDTLNTSFLESFDSTSYTAATRFMPSSLEHKDLLLYGRYSLSHTGSNLNAYGRDTLCWRNRAGNNNVDNALIMGGDGTDKFATTNGAAGKHPLNFLAIVKTEKFDRIHLRLDNQWGGVSTSNVEVSAYYTGFDGTWKPLEIIDDTQGLKTSGSIKFNMPSDWTQKSKSTIDGGTWTGPVHVDNVGTNIVNGEAPEDLWTFDAYGILLAFNVYGTSTKTRLLNLWTYNNSHSQQIQMIDPHHISLNDIAIAQSISFGRNTKTVSVEDKFGKADIRKLGASGGNISFGGIDLGGSDDQRKTIVSYQKDATPVFLDIAHKSGEITRFFGVITKVTEDHPAGLMYPKFGISMSISHILDLSSTGVINSDKISIGGAITDDGKYLL